MDRIISWFDYSGIWGQPFVDNGWDVWAMDIKHTPECDINLYDSVEECLEMFESVDGILAAPPCTDFALSGAQYWSLKDESGLTELSKELVRQVLRMVDLFQPTDPDWYEEAKEIGAKWFWALENPVGRLVKLFPEIGKPMYFNPCDYAGYLNLSISDHNELDRIRRKDGNNISAEEREFVVRCEAYTKKTGLWGDFNHDLIKLPIEPVRVCKQGSPIQSYGGKSNKPKRTAATRQEDSLRHSIRQIRTI
jgi:hypothetical protein